MRYIFWFYLYGSRAPKIELPMSYHDGGISEERFVNLELGRMCRP
jgi:hypothetical protein